MWHFLIGMIEKEIRPYSQVCIYMYIFIYAQVKKLSIQRLNTATRCMARSEHITQPVAAAAKRGLSSLAPSRLEGEENDEDERAKREKINGREEMRITSPHFTG